MSPQHQKAQAPRCLGLRYEPTHTSALGNSSQHSDHADLDSIVHVLTMLALIRTDCMDCSHQANKWLISPTGWKNVRGIRFRVKFESGQDIFNEQIAHCFFSYGGAINCEPNLLLSKHSDFDVEADRARSMHRLINRNMSFKQRMQQVITHNIDVLRWVRARMPGQVFKRFGYVCTCA